MTNQIKVIYEAPICDCGELMEPQLINVTNFGERQRYVLEWVCVSDEQHDSYVSRIWSQRNND
jgi:hypothetical protein